MEGLSRKRKHLETFFDSHTSPKDCQHFLQGPPGEANSNINTLELRSAHVQANNLAPRKIETKAAKKMRYEVRQVRQK